MKRVFVAVSVLAAVAGLTLISCALDGNPFDRESSNHTGEDDLRRWLDTSKTQDIDFEVTIQDGGTILWFSDPDFGDFIIPMKWRAELDTCADTTHPCVVVSSVMDYRCTVLPDTLWGIIKRQYSQPLEMLVCVGDYCRSYEGEIYDIRKYRANLISSCQ